MVGRGGGRHRFITGVVIAECGAAHARHRASILSTTGRWRADRHNELYNFRNPWVNIARQNPARFSRPPSLKTRSGRLLQNFCGWAGSTTRKALYEVSGSLTSFERFARRIKKASCPVRRPSAIIQQRRANGDRPILAGVPGLRLPGTPQICWNRAGAFRWRARDQFLRAPSAMGKSDLPAAGHVAQKRDSRLKECRAAKSSLPRSKSCRSAYARKSARSIVFRRECADGGKKLRDASLHTKEAFPKTDDKMGLEIVDPGER